MCTALEWNGLFGRTLDLEYGYDERVAVTPPHRLGNRYGIVGMAAIAKGMPLYFDGVNQRGLGMAGLNFPLSGGYPPAPDGREGVGSYELILRILGQCATVAEAVDTVQKLPLCDRSFSDELPATPLHWMVADATETAVIEPSPEGVRVYENPVGVLTNEPPFPHQLSHLSLYAHLTPKPPKGWQTPVSRGAGAMGLPGDYTSESRFVRGAFIRAHATPNADHPVGQFFRLMAPLAVPRGCVQAEDGRWVTTRYTCCMDLTRGIYYVQTYGCHRIHCVRGDNGDPEGCPIAYPIPKTEDVLRLN